MKYKFFEEKIRKLKDFCAEKSEIIAASFENGDIQIGGTQLKAMPPFFRICVCSSPEPGSNICTEIWLPENWNGIFLGLGNAGMAGFIWYAQLEKWVRRGYAVANTDLGTSAGEQCGIGTPSIWKDFGWRATHLMTKIGKVLLHEFYKKKEKYSYFLGESTGGQQALSVAQRFPNDYDGILAGSPANNRTLLHIYFLWNHNHLRPPNSSPLFRKDEIAHITSLANSYFQNCQDEEKGDLFISYPPGQKDDIDEFIKYLSHTKPSFSKKQLEALHAVYWGPVNPRTGKRIYSGMPIGSERFSGGIADCQNEQCLYNYPFLWAFGKDYNGYNFDFDKDCESLQCKLAGDLNANNPDLSAFKDHGGKLIVYSGSTDPCVPFSDSLHYYERVLKKMGGYKYVIPFFRYFLFPGKDHGLTGPGVNEILTEDGQDCLVALRLWREHGIAPEFLTAVSYLNGNKATSISFMRKIPYEQGARICPPASAEEYLKN